MLENMTKPASDEKKVRIEGIIRVAVLKGGGIRYTMPDGTEIITDSELRAKMREELVEDLERAAEALKAHDAEDE